MVQAAPTGFSAVIDHRGRVLVRTELGKRAVIVRDVGLRTGRTAYERAGDLPVLVLSGLLVLWGWLSALGTEADPRHTAGARRERRAFKERRAIRTRP